MLERTKLINQIIKENGYKSYLEIGHHTGENFRAVECKHKVSVDPDDTHGTPTHKVTSDEFFRNNKERFDLIFVDGMHLSDYVFRDVINSLNCLNPDGTILIHDCLPEKEERQYRERVTNNWQGDVWKAIVQFARDGFNMELLDIETGIVKMTWGEERSYNIPDGDLTWKWYVKNFRNMWL